jgi:hypothetical protein
MNPADDSATTEWSRDTQKIAVLSWISFLVASAFTMLLFAFVDPLMIVESIDLPVIESPNAGYAVGFFFLWAHGWISGWLVLRLVRRKRNWPRRP